VLPVDSVANVITAGETEWSFSGCSLENASQLSATSWLCHGTGVDNAGCHSVSHGTAQCSELQHKRATIPTGKLCADTRTVERRAAFLVPCNGNVVSCHCNKGRWHDGPVPSIREFF